MNARCRVWSRCQRSLVVVLLAVLAPAAPAAVPLTADGPIVQLPPMIVGESTGRPWLYARLPDGEYLSRCSPRLTRSFIEAHYRLSQILRVLVPGKFLLRTDVPPVMIVVGVEEKLAASDLVAQEVRGKVESSGRLPAAGMPVVRFLSDLRLDDRDMSAMYVMLDGRAFDGDQLRTTPAALRMLMERRAPMLPPWLIEGVVAVYAGTKVEGDTLVFPRLHWLPDEDRGALLNDPQHPRALLPAEEFFAPDALRDRDGNEPRRDTWHGQAALFFRWALDPANGPARAGLWRFVERAETEPVTEEMFESCFGFGFSDLRDRLSDYLPGAVRNTLQIPLGKLPAMPRVEIRPATRGEIARLRGEWERIEIDFVKQTQPEFAPRYIELARRTVQRALDEGESDPRLLALLGLCELDAGNESAARALLETAISGGVVRPRAYHEVARLRFAELARDEPAAGDLDALVRGASLFRWRPALCYRLAVVLARHGRNAEAAAIVEDAMARAVDDPSRVKLVELQFLLGRARR